MGSVPWLGFRRRVAGVVVAALLVPVPSAAAAAGPCGDESPAGHVPTGAVSSPDGVGTDRGPDGPTWRVRLLGEREIPKDVTVGGLAVGELSGLDYDRRTGKWYIVSDDSEEGPARFFTARIELGRHGMGAVRFTGATEILRTDGSTFPPLGTPDDEVADPESVRFDPRTRTLYWSSEGKREVPTDGTAPALVDPWVRQMTTQGRHLRQLRQPAMFAMSAAEQGPRRNAVFEGLTLTADGRQLVTTLEGPRYEDGPLPTQARGAVSRLTWYDRWSGRAERQLAYELDPIPAEPLPPGAGADNGVVEILAVDRHRYLVLERSFVTGVGNSIRVYETDVRGATDVLGDDSLADGDYRPVRKRLVVDFATLGLEHVDNVEGMAFGPRLASGERTLVFVSDDNFNPAQVSQVIALAVR
jgi:hypothetical protein